VAEYSQQWAGRVTGSSGASGASVGQSLIYIMSTSTLARLPRGLSRAPFVLVAAALLLGACADGPPPTSPIAPSDASLMLVSTPISFTQVDAGTLNTCAVTSAGAVACWGDNAFGQTTVPAAAGAGMVQVSASLNHTCALSSAGAVLCWGDNTEGQSTVPAEYQSSGVTQVSAGDLHTCVLRTDKQVACWGNNADGRATFSGDVAPGKIVQLSAGAGHSCAVSGTDDWRRIACWGLNGSGQTSDQYPDSGAKQVSAGDAHTCIVNTVRESQIDGAIRCRGSNSDGQLDWPSETGRAIAVSAGAYHTCALNSAGVVTCWGRNTSSQSTVPADIPTGIMQVSAGSTHTCALGASGALACWGANGSGQSTVPTTISHVLPTATFVAPGTAIVGQNFTLALTNASVVGFTSTFAYAFDCGTGTYGAASASASRTCATGTPGTRAVRGKVIDQDNDITEYTANVTVISAADAISALRNAVGTSTLVPDIRGALTSKLDEAVKSLAAGKTKTACNSLSAFASQVQAQRGKAIPVATANAWLAQISAIQTAAGC
jgi:alpha-tubulin suppressor-like RCC1 family protein